jgi:hypothetical protein
MSGTAIYNIPACELVGCKNLLHPRLKGCKMCLSCTKNTIARLMSVTSDLYIGGEDIERVLDTQIATCSVGEHVFFVYYQLLDIQDHLLERERKNWEKNGYDPKNYE